MFRYETMKSIKNSLIFQDLKYIIKNPTFWTKYAKILDASTGQSYYRKPQRIKDKKNIKYTKHNYKM